MLLQSEGVKKWVNVIQKTNIYFSFQLLVHVTLATFYNDLMIQQLFIAMF